MNLLQTIEFSNISNLWQERTFRFSPFSGKLTFTHHWSLTCRDNSGKYTGNGKDSTILLPFSDTLTVSNAAGKKNFGKLIIELVSRFDDSAKIRYRIQCFRPYNWHELITYTGTLSSVTIGPVEAETIQTFIDNSYESTSLRNTFDFDQFIYVQATNGAETGGEKICTIGTDRDEEIQIILKESALAPRFYRGSFRLTKNQTDNINKKLHIEEFEKASLKCDVNGDDVFSFFEVWASGIPPVSPKEGGEEGIETFESADLLIPKIQFVAEETVYVRAICSNPLATRGLPLVITADSGDKLVGTLREVTFNTFIGEFIITAGATDVSNNRIHLEEGEGARVLTFFLQSSIVLVVKACRIYRSPSLIVIGEKISVYEDSSYSIAQDTFLHEEIAYVDATDSITTGGTKILKVISDSANEISVVLEEGPSTHYRGSFQITNATTDDERNLLHLKSGERAVLSCDIDGDGSSANFEIWCIFKLPTPPDDNAIHYRIQVNTRKDMLGAMLWDSQKCSFLAPVAPNDRCPDIEYAGLFLDLTGNTTYWWRIKFWLQSGEETLWSSEEAYFSGPLVPIIDPDLKILAALDIRKPRGKAEVEINDIWVELPHVTSISISNNKNPLDNIETAQGTAYLSNIDRKFYSDYSASEFFNELFGRRIRLSLGFLDYIDSGSAKTIPKMLGIIKAVNTDRVAKTAEIIVLEFMDFYRTKRIKITPVYKDLKLSELYCELIRHCFPSWLNQHETKNWDYWFDPLGFRQTNVYIGTGKFGGSEFIPIRDWSFIPYKWIYNIIPGTEAVYDGKGFRLKLAIDYEMVYKTIDKGIESWIHFLKTPYPTDKNSFYVSFTVDVQINRVQYKDTTLIEVLEQITLVSNCRLYTDEQGRLVSKNNALKEIITDSITASTNLMNLTTRKDIDSIINHVVVESRPYQIGTSVEIGSLEIVFGSRPQGEAGREISFFSEEHVENFRFDLTWSIECSNLFGTSYGSGSIQDFELPLRDPIDGQEGLVMDVSDIILIFKIVMPDYGRIFIEAVDLDAEHITVKFYISCDSPTNWYDTIVFSATLRTHAQGVGQPITYKAEAIDEVSYQDRYIRRKKQTFVLEYLEPGETQVSQAARQLLANLRKIRVYYDCTIRGLPHLRLMDSLVLTEPDASLSEKKMQVIKLIDNMSPANYISEIGLLDQVKVAKVPGFQETLEFEHQIRIYSQVDLVQTVRFDFVSEIKSYDFKHSFLAKATTKVDVSIPWPFPPFPPFEIDCTAEGAEERFDLPYTVDIIFHFNDSSGKEHSFTFGSLSISLIEETSYSVTVRYVLFANNPEVWFWPIDWESILTLKAIFLSTSPGTGSGESEEDVPHFPDDEPNAPDEDQPDNGWVFDPDTIVRKRLIGIGSGYAKPLELNYKWILDNVSAFGINCVRFSMFDIAKSISESNLSTIYDFCNYAREKGIIVVYSLTGKRASSSSSDWPWQAGNITRIYNKLKDFDNIIYETGNELTQGFSYEKKIVDRLRALGAEEIMSSALSDQNKIKPYVDYFSYHSICGVEAINKEIGSKTVYDTDGCSLSILTPSNLYEMTKKALQRDSHLFFDEGLKEDGSFTDEARIRALKEARDDLMG